MGTARDGRRDRVYVTRASGVTSLVATTGAQAWRTRPRLNAAVLGVGPSGRVYLSIARRVGHAVRAVSPVDGRMIWQRNTRLPVQDALELSDGLVAVSTGPRYGHTPADRLTLLNPRRPLQRGR